MRGEGERGGGDWALLNVCLQLYPRRHLSVSTFTLLVLANTGAPTTTPSRAKQNERYTPPPIITEPDMRLAKGAADNAATAAKVASLGRYRAKGARSAAKAGHLYLQRHLDDTLDK